eukprot:Lankesteria_metandrocarpae@DN8195_c0_g1_i1.p1
MDETLRQLSSALFTNAFIFTLSFFIFLCIRWRRKDRNRGTIPITLSDSTVPLIGPAPPGVAGNHRNTGANPIDRGLPADTGNRNVLYRTYTLDYDTATLPSLTTRLWDIKTDQFFSMDVQFYLSFVKGCAATCAVLSLIVGLLVVPVNVSMRSSRNADSNVLDIMSCRHVTAEDSVAWILYIATWLNSAVVYYFVHSIYLKVKAYRWADTGAFAPQKYALMVRGVPPHQTDSHAFKKHFDVLQPGRVVAASVVLDFSALLTATAKFSRYHDLIEQRLIEEKKPRTKSVLAIVDSDQIYSAVRAYTAGNRGGQLTGGGGSSSFGGTGVGATSRSGEEYNALNSSSCKRSGGGGSNKKTKNYRSSNHEENGTVTGDNTGYDRHAKNNDRSVYEADLINGGSSDDFSSDDDNSSYTLGDRDFEDSSSDTNTVSTFNAPSQHSVRQYRHTHNNNININSENQNNSHTSTTIANAGKLVSDTGSAERPVQTGRAEAQLARSHASDAVRSGTRRQASEQYSTVTQRLKQQQRLPIIDESTATSSTALSVEDARKAASYKPVLRSAFKQPHSRRSIQDPDQPTWTTGASADNDRQRENTEDTAFRRVNFSNYGDGGYNTSSTTTTSRSGHRLSLWTQDVGLEELERKFMDHWTRLNESLRLAPSRGTGVGFVAFDSTEAASDCLCDPRLLGDNLGWEVSQAPPPGDIIWSNIHLTPTVCWLRAIALYMGLFALSVVLTSSALVSNWVSPLMENLERLVQADILRLSTSGWTSPLFLFVINSVILPYCVAWCAQSTGYFRETYQTAAVLHGNAIFLVLNSLIFPVFGTGSVWTLVAFIYESKIEKWNVTISGLILMQSGTFAIKYLLNACFLSSSAQLLLLPQMVYRHVCKMLNWPEVPWYFDFGYHYAFCTSIFTLALTLSIFLPLVLPLATFFFCLKFWLDKYNFAFSVWEVDVDSAGSITQTALNYILGAVTFMQFVMSGFFLKIGLRNDRYLTLAGTLLFTVSSMATVLQLGQAAHVGSFVSNWRPGHQREKRMAKGAELLWLKVAYVHPCQNNTARR